MPPRSPLRRRRRNQRPRAAVSSTVRVRHRQIRERSDSRETPPCHCAHRCRPSWRPTTVQHLMVRRRSPCVEATGGGASDEPAASVLGLLRGCSWASSSDSCESRRRGCRLARMAPFRPSLPCTSMLSCLPPQPPRNAPPATAPIAATTAHCWHGGYKQQHRGNATSGCRNAASATTRELTQPSPSLSSFLASLSSFLASLSSADDCESTTIHSFRAMFQPSGHVDA